MKLLALQKDAHDQFGQVGEFESDAHRRRSFLSQLDDVVSLLAGAWVTDVLERNCGQNQPVLNSTIDALLEMPIGPDDPSYDQKLYRRWLYGKAPQLDENTVKIFLQRLKASRSS